MPRPPLRHHLESGLRGAAADLLSSLLESACRTAGRHLELSARIGDWLEPGSAQCRIDGDAIELAVADSAGLRLGLRRLTAAVRCGLVLPEGILQLRITPRLLSLSPYCPFPLTPDGGGKSWTDWLEAGTRYAVEHGFSAIVLEDEGDPGGLLPGGPPVDRIRYEASAKARRWQLGLFFRESGPIASCPYRPEFWAEREEYFRRLRREYAACCGVIIDWPLELDGRRAGHSCEHCATKEGIVLLGRLLSLLDTTARAVGVPALMLSLWPHPDQPDLDRFFSRHKSLLAGMLHDHFSLVIPVISGSFFHRRHGEKWFRHYHLRLLFAFDLDAGGETARGVLPHSFAGHLHDDLVAEDDQCQVGIWARMGSGSAAKDPPILVHQDSKTVWKELNGWLIGEFGDLPDVGAAELLARWATSHLAAGCGPAFAVLMSQLSIAVQQVLLPAELIRAVPQDPIRTLFRDGKLIAPVPGSPEYADQLAVVGGLADWPAAAVQIMHGRETLDRLREGFAALRREYPMTDGTANRIEQSLEQVRSFAAVWESYLSGLHLILTNHPADAHHPASELAERLARRAGDYRARFNWIGTDAADILARQLFTRK